MCMYCNGTGYEQAVDETGVVEAVRCYECDGATGGLHMAVTRLIGELRADGISNPLGATMTLGAVLTDLYRMAGVKTPIGLESWVGA